MDPETRERLILEHRRQVEIIAAHYKIRSACPIDWADLIAVGMEGLIGAIDRWDESRGIKLRTFVERRIHGAMLDYMRREDWCSRHRRKKAKDLEAAMLRAAQRCQGVPDSAEIAAEMGISLERLRKLQADVQAIELLSLDEIPHWRYRDRAATVREPEERTAAYVYDKEISERLASEAAALLPEQERIFVELYFFGNLSLQETADRMEIHVSRVFELKRLALAHLRASVLPKWPRRGELVTSAARAA